jgi:hypothetical protein
MRFRQFILGAALLAFMGAPMMVAAAEPTPATALSSELPDAGILPDSPWYAFKQLRNWAALTFEFNQAKRASRMIDQANLRISEAEALRERGKTEQAEKLVARAEKLKARAEKTLAREKEKGRNVESILEKADRHAARHEAVLKRVADQVDNPTAKERILRNLERHKEHQAALEKLRDRHQLKERREAAGEHKSATSPVK